MQVLLRARVRRQLQALFLEPGLERGELRDLPALLLREVRVLPRLRAPRVPRRRPLRRGLLSTEDLLLERVGAVAQRPNLRGERHVLAVEGIAQRCAGPTQGVDFLLEDVRAPRPL